MSRWSLSFATIAALFLGAGGVSAVDLSDELRATADLCQDLAQLPAQQRVGAVVALGYVQQQTPFASLRDWWEAPTIGLDELTAQDRENRWKRLVRSFDLTAKYDAFVLFASASGDRLLSITHPEFYPVKADRTKFICELRGFGWITSGAMQAANDAAGFTQERAEDLQMNEPDTQLVTRILPGNDDRDMLITASFQARGAAPSRPIFSIAAILNLPAPTS
jgi:hypothetical protein